MKKVAYYYPLGSDPSIFEKFTGFVKDVEFLFNDCDADCAAIYCNGTCKLPDALSAKDVYDIPIVCFVWDIPMCLGRDVRPMLNALSYCDRVISASEATQLDLLTLNIDSSQMYFFVDVEQKFLTNPSKERNIVQVSRFMPHKCFHLSIVAAHTVAPLTCVGVPQHQIYRENLPPGATYIHNADRGRVIHEISKASILVSPSIFEGWGMSPIEATICGTPIILADVPVFREVYGDAAIYHRANDIYDLRKKLELLIDDLRLQKKVVKKCRKKIEKFTAKSFAERWRKDMEKELA